jgi:hypothetical protein
VKVNAVLWYHITDAAKLVIAVADSAAAVYQLVLTSLRNIIGTTADADGHRSGGQTTLMCGSNRNSMWLETAEKDQKRLILNFGFAAKEHIALAEKLLSEPSKERFDRVVEESRIESRDGHLRVLRSLVKEVRALDEKLDKEYLKGSAASTSACKGTARGQRGGNSTSSSRRVSRSSIISKE